MDDPNELVFKGSSPEECEAFISTIRKRAFAEQKHRDNEWMAYLASSCFVGDAFYWFEELDSNIQDDWSQLRPAMVAKFGRKSIVSPATGLRVSASASPSPTIPTPAAAPPTQGSLRTGWTGRTGRLRVLELGGSFRGYLSAGILADGAYRDLTSDRNSAMMVLIPPVGTISPFEIKIQTPRGGFEDSLAMMWTNLPRDEWPREQLYRASCCSLSRAQDKSWAFEAKMWSIIDESELRPQYPFPTGGIQGLKPDIFYRTRLTWIKSEADSPNRRQYRVVFEEVES